MHRPHAQADDWQEGDRVRNIVTGRVGTVTSSTPRRTSGGWEWTVDVDVAHITEGVPPLGGGEVYWHSASIAPAE